MNEIKEKNLKMEKQEREREMELRKLRNDIDIIEMEKQDLLKKIQDLEDNGIKNDDNYAKVLELEATVILDIN